MRLPMFPLGNVVLPGEVVPLRVFEPRYRRLVLDCLAAEGTPEFGIALIERGSEVGGGDERASVGTRAIVRTVAPLGAGRFNIVALGSRRITVLEWLPDDPYPLADVEDWPEPTLEGAALDDARVLTAAVADRVHDVRELAREVQGRGDAPPAVTLSDDVVLAGYQLAAAVPLGPADRLKVLEAPNLAARLQTLLKALDDVDAVLRFRLGRPATGAE